jgi:ADP-ribose pyrophosphatase YjhB (NUDIX family)
MLTLPAVIRIDDGAHRFHYRVAAVGFHDGRVLVHRAEYEPFWTLPGGRAELGETAEDTIRREMREEIATDVDVMRLLWLVENFFDYDDHQYHELGLYFLVRFPEGSAPLASDRFESSDGGVKLLFKWVPLDADALLALPLMPSCLSERLPDLPVAVTHIVHRDGALYGHGRG